MATTPPAKLSLDITMTTPSWNDSPLKIANSSLVTKLKPGIETSESIMPPPYEYSARAINVTPWYKKYKYKVYAAIAILTILVIAGWFLAAANWHIVYFDNRVSSSSVNVVPWPSVTTSIISPLSSTITVTQMILPSSVMASGIQSSLSIELRVNSLSSEASVMISTPRPNPGPNITGGKGLTASAIEAERQGIRGGISNIQVEEGIFRPDTTDANSHIIGAREKPIVSPWYHLLPPELSTYINTISSGSSTSHKIQLTTLVTAVRNPPIMTTFMTWFPTDE